MSRILSLMQELEVKPETMVLTLNKIEKACAEYKSIANAQKNTGFNLNGNGDN